MKRPTQVDVARLAGVSTATVSYVVNDVANGRVSISEETRLRVLAAVDKLGYVPDARAQSLASGGTSTIGLITPDIHNPHFWETIDGVEQEARDAGYRILLSSITPDYKNAEDIFKDLSNRRIDGLILMGTFIDQSEATQITLNRLLKRRLPIVEISDRFDVNHNIDRVVSDYREATREVMAHLLSLAHRRIGLIYGVATPELAEDRRQPYLDCLREAGLAVNPDLIVECGPTIEDGYQAARQLLQRPSRPTALLAINDLLAIGAMRAAGDLNLAIPHDVSLAGFDDIPMARYLMPRLTTASKDASNLGREAAKLLLARLNDPFLPRRETRVATRLILRESIGAAPI
jgi:LacI family transcriptional regulator